MEYCQQDVYMFKINIAFFMYLQYSIVIESISSKIITVPGIPSLGCLHVQNLKFEFKNKFYFLFSRSILTLQNLCTCRTCVNGSTIHQKTKVKNGDRILWGNNHFFRINCPKQNSKISLTALF